MDSRLAVQVYKDETEPLYLVQVYKCIVVNLEDCNAGCARWCGPSVHLHVVSRGVWGILPQENCVKLDARRSLLRQFLHPKSQILSK